MAIEERTVLFPSSYKRIGTERLGGVIPSVDPGQFLKALPPLLSKHLLLTRQLLEGAEEKTLWRRRQHREKKREEKTLWRRCQHRYQRTCALALADIFIFAMLARGAAGAKSVEQWVRKKAFNASKDGRRDIFTCGYSWSA